MGEEVRAEVIQQTSTPGKIYQLIGQAIGKIGAIGKSNVSKDRNGTEQFKYRGIDQVYNALNPVMAELGLFFCPEVVEQRREERTTRNGAVLMYTLLTMRYTVYAPDGSYVQMTVLGEGMDSGDKSSNKAMSVAMKYAVFQLFCIPTEEMKDPDTECYDNILPKGTKPTQTAKAQTPKNNQAPAKAQEQGKGNVSVTTSETVPPPEQPKPAQPDVTTGSGYILNEMTFMAKKLNLDKEAMSARFRVMRKALIDGGLVPDIPSTDISLEEAKKLCHAMYENYIDDQVA